MTEEVKKEDQKRTIHVPKQTENHLPGEHANPEEQLKVDIDRWLEEGMAKTIEEQGANFKFSFSSFKSFRAIVHRQVLRGFAPLNMKFTIKRCACLAAQDRPGFIKCIRERSFRLAVLDQAFTQLTLARAKIPHECFKAFTDQLKTNE